jgi:hypothetical protein
MQSMSNAVYLFNLAVCTIQIIVNFLQFTLTCFIGVQRLTVSLVILDPYINVKEAMVRLSVYAYLCICMCVCVCVCVSDIKGGTQTQGVPRRLFGPKRDEVTGGWRKLHNEELHSLYASPSIIRMINSRRMRCAGHVARMG